MLREAMEYLTTPCPPLARRFGYLTQAVALGARYRRQRRAWAPHVAACHRFIAEAAERVPPGGRALVAGSGRLIEIPLERLAERFDEVVLLDLVHVRPVRRAASRFANVRLVELDITGALAPLDRLLTGRPRPGFALPAAEPPQVPGGRFDFAVSCNLLSQLPLMPLDFIERKAPSVTEAERADFARSLASGHLGWLAGAAERAALFTDVETLWLDGGGTVVDRDESLCGLSLPAPDVQWLWDIAPSPEQDRHHDMRHRVGGWFEIGPLAAAVPALSC